MPAASAACGPQRHPHLTRSFSRLLNPVTVERCDEGFRRLPALREALTRQTVESGSFQTLAGSVREALWRGAGWSQREVRSQTNRA